MINLLSDDCICTLKLGEPEISISNGRSDIKGNDEKQYPNATVATTTCVLDESQSSRTELRTLLLRPAW